MVLLLLMFGLAGAIRLYDIDQTFVGLLPVREFRSAIIARDLYLSLTPDAPTWEMEVSAISSEREWSLEPPVLEMLAAVTYRLTGGERLWVPRLYATFFFLASGLLFWKIARHLFDDSTALVLGTYYLFVPVGVIASKSFQPDTLMLVLYMATLLAMLQYDVEPTRRRLLWTALLAGLTVFIRPLGVFPITGAFAGLAVFRLVRREGRPWGHLAVFGVGLLVGMSYYIEGMVFADRLSGQAEMTFRPHLLWMREFWTGWVVTGLDTVTLAGLVAGLLGLALIGSQRLVFLLFGLWASYFTFGVIFNYHIATHSYYHLQVVPTIALSAGSLVAVVLERIRRSHFRRLRTVWLHGVLALFVLVAARRVIQHGRQANDFEPPELAETIGTLVEHSTSVVYLARYYGRPLEYFGRLSGTFWPRPTMAGIYDPAGARDVSIADRLAALDFLPEYFVITDHREFQRYHEDLAAYLADRCELRARDDRYLVYHRCH